MAIFSDVYMARQPIFDRQRNVAAYELLYRSGNGATAGEIGDLEAGKAIANSVVDIGLDTLVGQTTAYVNVDPKWLDNDALLLFPKERVVLEILETVQWSSQVEARLHELHHMGYTLALDDYTFLPEHDPILQLTQIVKVDVLAIDPRNYARQIRALRTRGLKLLAEKVEDANMFHLCSNLGFDYFQGYFFAKPEVVSDKKISAAKLNAVRLISKLQDRNAALSDIEKLVEGDVAIGYRVLKLMNSASVGIGRKVDTIREALLLLGTVRVTALATLIAMTSVSDAVPELMNVAMVRSRMAESLARKLGHPAPERHLTVGLLSVLPALLSCPIRELLAALPVSPIIRAALLGEDATLPEYSTLFAVLAFERGDWDMAERFCPNSTALREAYQEALVYAKEMGGALGNQTETASRDKRLVG